jgi:glycosyltransferase involved in cell wall biosynthesis
LLRGVTGWLATPRGAGARIRRPGAPVAVRPSVSVVIPCYNYGRYLHECVKSIITQDGVDVDVLIVDDASTDDSAAVAAAIAAGDGRVRLMCHEVNKGHIATYNDGLAEARGTYVTLVSADDRLTPGCLARATSLMERYPSVGLTYGFAANFSDDHLPSARTEPVNWILWPGHNWVRHCCKTGRNVLRSPEAVMRTSILQKIGGYRSDLPHAADFEMWLRAAATADVGFVGGADQAYYRLHSSNMHHTSFNVLLDMEQRLKCFDVLFRDWPQSDSLRDQVHRTLAREAVGHGISAFARNQADRELIDGYARFARQTWPAIEQAAGWRVLRRLQAGRGRTTTPSGLGLASRERVRKVSYALRWWRKRWAGV